MKGDRRWPIKLKRQLEGILATPRSPPLFNVGGGAPGTLPPRNTEEGGAQGARKPSAQAMRRRFNFFGHLPSSQRRSQQAACHSPRATRRSAPAAPTVPAQCPM